MLFFLTGLPSSEPRESSAFAGNSGALAGAGYTAAEVSKKMQTGKMLVTKRGTSLSKAALG